MIKVWRPRSCSSLSLHPSIPVWHVTVISCPMSWEMASCWLKAASCFNPPPLSPPRPLDSLAWNLKPLVTLWTMAKISCQFPFGCVSTRLYLPVLCSRVASARHQMSRTWGRWTVENNLVCGCSCHVGLTSFWTVIYFKLPQLTTKAPACCK